MNDLRPVTLALALLASPPAWSQETAGESKVPASLHAIDARNALGLQDFFRHVGDSLPLVSAHRGGAGPGFPENCLATFEHTLRHTYAILEVDPRFTKDGTIVLHHDPQLERTTTGKGLVAEKTLRELKQLRLKDTLGEVSEHQIPTLDEALQWARGKTILVIDQKDVPVQARVRKIEEHQAEAHAILIVYSFKDARKCYAMNKKVMMEVMIPSGAKVLEFEKTGVPWCNIVAFVGHTPPRDKQLMQMLHAKGVCCIVGTSRNLDQKLDVAGADLGAAGQAYEALLHDGADLIETDLPRAVGEMLYGELVVPESKAAFFHRK